MAPFRIETRSLPDQARHLEGRDGLGLVYSNNLQVDGDVWLTTDSTSQRMKRNLLAAGIATETSGSVVATNAARYWRGRRPGSPAGLDGPIQLRHSSSSPIILFFPKNVF